MTQPKERPVPYTLEQSVRAGRHLLWAAINDDTGEAVFTDADRRTTQNMVDALNEQEKAWALAHGLEPPPPPEPNRTGLIVIYDVLYALLADGLVDQLVSTDVNQIEIENVLIAIEDGLFLESPVGKRRLTGGKAPKFPKDDKDPKDPKPEDPPKDPKDPK
jgi:hypothetical protein